MRRRIATRSRRASTCSPASPDPKEAERIFTRLAASGAVTMPFGRPSGRTASACARIASGFRGWSTARRRAEGRGGAWLARRSAPVVSSVTMAVTRRPSHDRRGVAHRVAARLIASARRGWLRDVGTRRGAGAGRARDGARAVATSGIPDNPGRLAHDDRQQSRHRSAAPRPHAGAQHERTVGHELEMEQEFSGRSGRRRAPMTRSAMTCCG